MPSSNKVYCLILLAILCTSCQQTIPLKPYFVQPPRTVLVTGEMFYAHDTIPIQGFSVVFTRERKDRSVELVTDSQMPKTGHYRVRLSPGKTYQAALMMGSCRVETQEYWVSTAPEDSIQLKSFHMNYPDSTDYGGCLAGWRPYR